MKGGRGGGGGRGGILGPDAQAPPNPTSGRHIRNDNNEDAADDRVLRRCSKGVGGGCGSSCLGRPCGAAENKLESSWGGACQGRGTSLRPVQAFA